MAHDPKLKAKVMTELSQGIGAKALSQKYKLSINTIDNWQRQLNAAVKKASIDQRRQTFSDALVEMGTAILKALTAQAEMLSDPAYVSKQTTADVVAHTKFLRDSLTGFIKLEQSAGAPSALPQSTEYEHVEAELVEPVAEG